MSKCHRPPCGIALQFCIGLCIMQPILATLWLWKHSVIRKGAVVSCWQHCALFDSQGVAP